MALPIVSIALVVGNVLRWYRCRVAMYSAMTHLLQGDPNKRRIAKLDTYSQMPRVLLDLVRQFIVPTLPISLRIQTADEIRDDLVDNVWINRLWMSWPRWTSCGGEVDCRISLRRGTMPVQVTLPDAAVYYSSDSKYEVRINEHGDHPW